MTQRPFDDPNVQLVVELTGAEPAYEWVRGAAKGKDVVTANKALLQRRGENSTLAGEGR